MRDRWDHRAGKNIRVKFKQMCEQAGAVCWLCGQPIDYRLTHPHKMAFQSDHFIPRKHRPDLALDFDNLRPSHAACNNQRKTKPPPAPQAPPARSQRW